jgi:DNA-binding SARP family transcriptional activator
VITLVIEAKFFSQAAISLNGALIKIPFSKAEGLLYCLFVQKSMGKDVLCEMFWGDCPEDLARKSLRNAIYVLRKLFGDNIIVSAGGHFSLGAEYRRHSDLQLLQEDYMPSCRADIAQLLDMYRQDFLGTFKVKNAQGYEEWLLLMQEKYRKEYLKKLEQGAQQALESEETDLAEACWRRLIALENYEERYYLQLIRLLLSQNRLSECMKLYNRLEKTLKDDLGIQPSAEISALLEKTLKQQVIAESPYETFYGREKELTELHSNFLAFMKDEQYYSYILYGEAGIGKTQLAYKFVGSLRGDFLFFDISNYWIDKDYSYKLWDSILKNITYTIQQGRVQAPEHLLQAISNAFPFFGLGGDTADNLNGLPHAAQAEEYIVQLMKLVCRQHKLILVADDLQWVDKRSIDLLIKVMHACDDLLVLAALRDDFGELWDHFAGSMQRKVRMKRIFLPRFNALQTQELVSLLLPELAGYGAAIYRESEGNPFFIAEMVNNARAGLDIEQLSQNMSDFIGARLLRLSLAARSLVNICAAIQGEISLELLSRISGIRNIDLVEILEELLHMRVLKEFPNIQGEVEFFFTHQKIREYIYQDISLAKRKIIHEKIGQSMEAIFVEEKRSHTYYPRLIYHYSVSGNIYKVIKYRLHHLAILIKARHEIFPAHVDINQISISCYLDPQKDTNEEFYELAELLHDPRLHCTKEELDQLNFSYSFLFGRYNSEYGDEELGNKALRQAQAEAGELSNPRELAEAYLQLIQHYFDADDLTALEEMLLKAEQVPYMQGHPALAPYLSWYKGYMLICRGCYGEGEAIVEQAIEMTDIRQEDAFTRLAAAYFTLGESRLRRGDYAAAERRLRYAKRHCPNNPLHSGQAVINLELGMIHYQRGDFENALKCLTESLDYYRQSIFMWYRALLYCYLAKTYNKLGEVNQALEFARSCLSINERHPSRYQQQEIEGMRREFGL